MSETNLPQPRSPAEQRLPATPEAAKPPRELQGFARFLVEPKTLDVLTGGLDTRTRAYLGIETGKEIPAVLNLGDAMPSRQVMQGMEAHYQLLAGGKDETTSLIDTGTGRFIQARTYALREEGRQPIYETICTDVTESVLQERQAAQEQTRQASMMIRTAMHEVKQPLTTIRGWTDILINTPELEGLTDVQEALKAVRDNAFKLSGLSQEYLDYAHLTSEKKPVLAPVDMEFVLLKLKHLLKLKTEETKATVSYPERLPAPMGVTDNVEDVLMNLLTNALKYGGDNPKAEIRAVNLPDNKIRYEVEDHGPGIPADRIPELFKPFGRLQLSGQLKKDSTGLGLAIAKGKVEQMGGTIGVNSEVGKGSTFYFILDAAPETATRLPEEQKA